LASEDASGYYWLGMFRKLIIVLGIVVLFPLVTKASDNFSLLITEVQTGSATNTSEEFIEIANPTDQLVSVTGWLLQYKPATSGDWQTKLTLNGNIEPRGLFLATSKGYLADIASQEKDTSFAIAASGGHLRIVEPANGTNAEKVHDLLGWGTANASETFSATASIGGQSMKRKVNEDGLFIDTNNNRDDFFVSSTPTPKSSNPIELVEPEPEPPELPDVYLPLDITELFPDPASPQTDDNDEFVEVHNPNSEPVSTKGYYLKIGTTFNSIVPIPEVTIPSGDYYAFTSASTSLSLTNSGSNAQLLDPNNVILSTSQAYSNALSGISWSLIEGAWQWSTSPTPNAENILSKPVDDDGSVIADNEDLTACRPDQYRNPETNRCKLKESDDSTLKPCESNQIRNPETNRCKNISSSDKGLQACGPDQYRNPETNRCKKLAAIGALKQCGDGQVRNPETNRCRKDTSVKPADAAAVLSTKDVIKNLPLIAVIGGGALLYAIYEFRYDFRNIFHKARGYLGFRQSSGRDP